MRYDNPNGDFNYEPPRKNSTANTIIISITVILSIALIAGTVIFIFLWQNDKLGNSSASSVSDDAVTSSDANASSVIGTETQEEATEAEEKAETESESSENVLYNTLCNEYVTIRSSTSMESGKVGKVPKGAKVEIVNTVINSTFVHISYKGKDGYVLSAFFTKEKTANGRYVMYCGAKQYANLRSKPGSGADVIDVVLTNEPVQCTGNSEYVNGQRYLEVLYKDKTGYVLAAAMNSEQKGVTYKGN